MTGGNVVEDSQHKPNALHRECPLPPERADTPPAGIYTPSTGFMFSSLVIRGDLISGESAQSHVFVFSHLMPSVRMILFVEVSWVDDRSNSK